MPVRTVTAIVISTTICNRKSYVAALATRSWDGRKIPSYTENINHAKFFIDHDHAHRSIQLIINPHERQYEVEEVTVNERTQSVIHPETLN